MRVKNSIRNMSVLVLGQVFGILINFVNRTVFVKILGVEILGIHGLFTNIISLLSLAELGVGIAIIYTLYKPIAENSQDKINALLNYYRIIYRNIGILILVLGFSLIPFLKYIIKDELSVHNINLIFAIFILNSVVTYFFSYKLSILIADQKNYIVTMYHYGINFVSNLIQILFLITTGNYIIYLMINIVFRVIENLLISREADKRYPYIKKLKNSKLAREERRKITKNIRALAYHKLGAVVVNGTDNIVISIFLGLYWVGIYSNYFMIISALTMIIGQIFSAVTASVGNLNVLESKDKTHEIYNNILFANFWIFGFSSITLYILSKDFIILWLGKEFLLPDVIVLTVTFSFWLNGTRKTNLVFKDAMGLFWYDRYKPAFEAVINIILSIILVQKMGLLGVFIGTIISNLVTCFWIEPYVVYRYGFKMPLDRYFVKFATYTIVTGLIFILVMFVISFINFGPVVNLLLKGIVCLLIINLAYISIFFYTQEFRYFIKTIRGVLKK